MGIVREAGSGTPIPDVEVILDSGPSTRSAASGEFFIAGIAPGSHVVIVRRIGFTPLLDSIRVAGADTIRSVYRLTESAIALAPVVITAAERLRNRRLADFESRRASGGFGKFLTEDNWKNRPTATLKNILEQDVAGVIVAGNRVGSRHAGKMCALTMYINGQRASNYNPPPLDTFFADDLLALEVYRGPAETPLQFSGLGGECGAVVIWTR